MTSKTELFEIYPAWRDEAGADVFRVMLNAEHAVFGGHFPDNPILPGVCSLMIVRECAWQTAGVRLRYVAVKESKFLSAITPDADLTVKLKLSEEENTYSLNATISSGETIMLKLKATLTSDE
jgi:3-hydroxyacyl-[acyl-carrier-protein] dehydratase